MATGQCIPSLPQYRGFVKKACLIAKKSRSLGQLLLTVPQVIYKALPGSSDATQQTTEQTTADIEYADDRRPSLSEMTITYVRDPNDEE